MVRQTKLTLFQQHKERWKDCTRCTLHHGRKRVVFCRGDIPCDVLFVGEAPGKSEDVLGLPFVGPAGKLLDSIISQALGDCGKITLGKDGQEIIVRPRWAFTNLVSCIPLNEDGDKTSEPEAQEIKSCAPRLSELVRICKPRLIIRVGQLAAKSIIGQAQFGNCEWLGDKFMEFATIDHPAYILRQSAAHKPLLIRKAVVLINNAYQELT